MDGGMRWVKANGVPCESISMARFVSNSMARTSPVTPVCWPIGSWMKRLGLTTEVDELSILDPRTGRNTQHSVTGMIRQSVYSRLAGYEDTNDADRLRVDPAMRRVVGGRATEKTAASTMRTPTTPTVCLLIQRCDASSVVEPPKRRLLPPVRSVVSRPRSSWTRTISRN
jgi:hypothetical protein